MGSVNFVCVNAAKRGSHLQSGAPSGSTILNSDQI